MKREGPQLTRPGAPSKDREGTADSTARRGRFALVSQQVCWSDVHEFVLPKLVVVGDWPMIGSPAWSELDDRSPVKWASVLDAAQHWALRLEVCQQATCDASREISAEIDWTSTARFLKGRAEFFAARPWLGRHGWSC